MIELTKLNGRSFVLNADLIQAIEITPDTVITLTNDTKYVVKESKEEIVKKIVDYKRKIFGDKEL
ncbi:MAG: flagellar FlbD family protein [Tepidanaerobacteraceae bacterium]|jgi:flagellar protein FlbD|nr:flagellar FlbD family protein [Tepidanaerobacteraceae bacterium]